MNSEMENPCDFQGREKAGSSESGKPMKTVIETFREKLTGQIEKEIDEEKKKLLVKALQRGTELLEGR